MSGDDATRDLDLALTLAARADAITLARFGALDLRVDHKPDLTPVSDADIAVEQALRDVLARERPEDHILGEEHGGTPVFDGRQWVIDPIDGTKNFVRGVPVWASLIALLEDGMPDGRRHQRTGPASALVGRPGTRRTHVGRRRTAAAAVGIGGHRPWSRPACRSPACPAGPTAVCGSTSWP